MHSIHLSQYLLHTYYKYYLLTRAHFDDDGSSRNSQKRCLNRRKYVIELNLGVSCTVNAAFKLAERFSLSQYFATAEKQHSDIFVNGIFQNCSSDFHNQPQICVGR